MNVFQTNAAGISHAVTSTASTAVLLPTKDFTDLIQQGQCQIRVVNEGPNICFFATGGSSALAATLPTTTSANTCDAVLPGTDVTLTLKPVRDVQAGIYFSAICRAAGTATLSVYIGRGA